jgi:hypothetical protein
VPRLGDDTSPNAKASVGDPVALKFGKIFGELFVGSCPETVADVETLQSSLGISSVLNLQTDHDIRVENLDWKALQDRYRQLGINLHRLPIRDFDFEDLTEKLPECARTLRNLLRDGHTVYVHCSLGWNRSPTVAIAYLHWYRMWSLKRATQQVLACKDCDPAVDAIRRAAKPADAM